MRIANALTCIVAAFLGVVVGLVVARKTTMVSAAAEPVRATKFELTDKSGNTVATWGMDDGNQTVLSFTGKHKTVLAAIGIAADDLPFVKLYGRDGKARAVFYLSDGERPLLGMSDSEYEGRILLGFLQRDTANPRDDDWGLLFRAKSQDPFASVGMFRNDKNGSISGAFYGRNSDGKKWTAP
jgi:hypothetical protein